MTHFDLNNDGSRHKITNAQRGKCLECFYCYNHCHYRSENHCVTHILYAVLYIDMCDDYLY